MLNSSPPPRAAHQNDTKEDQPCAPKADVWFGPDFDPAMLGDARHVVVDGMPDPLNPFAEPQFETAIATEDDFEDDCPLCEMMRERVRAGEEFEITKVKWE